MNVDFKRRLKELVDEVTSNNREQIEKAKLDCLWEASNFIEVVINYIFLDMAGYSFDFGSTTIKKGTLLYRIRGFNEETDYSQQKEWLPPPNKPQNRANREEAEALYLGSSELICFLETHMKPEQKYVLGTYECIEDIELGGFINYDSNDRWLSNAASIINAFFIAPVRSEKNKQLFDFLDKQLSELSMSDLSDMGIISNAKKLMLLPYMFAVMNQKDKLYDITNGICDAITKRYPNGIRYSSCYIPLETPGISCSEYNVVLYSNVIEKVAFKQYEIKTFSKVHGKNGTVLTDVELAKILFEVTAE